MTVDIQSEEARLIRHLIPLSTLPSTVFAELCARMEVERVEAGQALFKRGDRDGEFVYLLEGSVNLQTEAFRIETVRAGSDSARFAIAHQMPRKVDAVALSGCQILRLDADMMKSVQGTVYEENESTMMVEELEDGDWMTTLLRSPIFRALPPANLQKILISLEEVRYQAGDVVIQQDDPGDYYYIIKKGSALVSRKPTPHAKGIKLGQLNDLDTFGEDALISGGLRSVSIIALTEMSLLRLGKEQFLGLIKQPTLKYVDYDELQSLLTNGAELIDVRGADDFKKAHLPHSVNVPFFSLRMYLRTLNRQQPIVVVCQDGRMSETAAFILLQNRFHALILRGGIAKQAAERLQTSAEPASFPIDDGSETSNYLEQAESGESLRAVSGIEGGEAVGRMAELQHAVRQLEAKCQSLEAERAVLERKLAQLAGQLLAAKEELQKLQGAK